jgi:hypothetical protein
MQLLVDVVGLTMILTGVVCAIMAAHNRTDGKRWEFLRTTPIWKMRERFNPRGYRFLIASVFLIVGSGLLGLATVWLS